jgi:hypothetical protein
MKKLFFLAGVVFAFVSCTTTVKTAKTADAPASLLSATIADLEISPNRVVVEYIPSKEVQRAGISNVKHAAEQEALKKDNADVLVNAEYTIQQTSYWIFGKNVDKVVVTGHPAKYKNFRSVNDSVWCNPFFRAGYQNNVSKGQGGFHLFK